MGVVPLADGSAAGEPTLTVSPTEPDLAFGAPHGSTGGLPDGAIPALRPSSDPGSVDGGATPPPTSVDESTTGGDGQPAASTTGSDRSAGKPPPEPGTGTPGTTVPNATATIAPQPTTTTTAASTTTTATTTTAQTTTTTAPPAALQWHIGSGGATSSQAQLPLDGSPAGGPLPNYDTDRDATPGLLVKRGAGLSESDGTKMQRWSESLSTPVDLVGVPRLTIWLAVKDFTTDKSGAIVAGLYDCDSGGSCTLLTSGTASFDQADHGSGFGPVVASMGSIDRTLGAGRVLRLKVAVPDSSEDDLWFAYGTDGYPSKLVIG